ncbi:hypothetical protein D082_04260 [Synechocystis sp. PCC 6714]|nr:hypothetical protein D082_04260 [Synechocystis sp. PCC 6714]
MVNKGDDQLPEIVSSVAPVTKNSPVEESSQVPIYPWGKN